MSQKMSRDVALLTLECLENSIFNGKFRRSIETERPRRNKDCQQITYLLSRRLSAYRSYGQALPAAFPSSFSDRIVASQPQSLHILELVFAQILGELRICVPLCG